METTLPANVYTIARNIAANVFVSSIERECSGKDEATTKDVNLKCTELIKNACSLLSLSILNSERSMQDIYDTFMSEKLGVGKVFIEGAVVFSARLYKNPVVNMDDLCECLAHSLCIYPNTEDSYHHTESDNQWTYQETLETLKQNPLIIFLILLTMEPLDHDALKNVFSDEATG